MVWDYHHLNANSTGFVYIFRMHIKSYFCTGQFRIKISQIVCISLNVRRDLFLDDIRGINNFSGPLFAHTPTAIYQRIYPFLFA